MMIGLMLVSILMLAGAVPAYATNITIAIEGNPATQSVGGRSTITFTAKSNGSALNGANVTFTTTLGTLSAASATTDSSGQASVTLTSNKAGRATVTGKCTMPDDTRVGASFEIIFKAVGGGGSSQTPSQEHHTITFTIGQNYYIVDGKPFTMDAAAFIANGRTLVPVRYLAYAMSASVQWDEATQKVTVTKGNTTIELVIGSSTRIINGVASDMDAVPIIVGGRTYLPARYIAEDLGYAVSWNDITKTVTVSN